MGADRTGTYAHRVDSFYRLSLIFLLRLDPLPNQPRYSRFPCNRSHAPRAIDRAPELPLQNLHNGRIITTP